MKKRLLLVILFWSTLGLASTSEEILKSAWTDPRVAIHQESLQLVESSKNYNPLEKTDLRLSKSEINQEDIKLGIRIYPKGYSEHVKTKEFQKALENSDRVSHAVALSSLLTERYNLIARIALIKEKRRNSVFLANINQKANKIFSFHAKKDRSELKSFLKNQSELDKFNVKLASMNRDYNNLTAELKDLRLSPVENFDISDLATVDNLFLRLDKINTSDLDSPLSIQEASSVLEKSRAAYAYEKARDEKWLAHVEISVNQNKNEKVYGVQAVFNLPFASAANLSQIDKEARLIKDRAKLIGTSESDGRNFKNNLTEIRTLVDIYKNLQSSKMQMRPEDLVKMSNKLAQQDPYLAIELQRIWFENREQMLDLEYRIRILFVSYLHESATLSKAPDVNYLSKSLKRIL